MKRKADKADQLTPAWKQAREEAIQRCQAKNNSDGTLANARRNTIYVALEFERLGVNGPEDINQEDFVSWTKGLRVVDAGGFEPPAFWLQTRRSSN